MPDSEGTNQLMMQIVEHHERKRELLTPEEIAGILTIIGHPITPVGVRGVVERLKKSKYLWIVKCRSNRSERPKHHVLFISDKERRRALRRDELYKEMRALCEEIRRLDSASNISDREARILAEQRAEEEFDYEVSP